MRRPIAILLIATATPASAAPNPQEAVPMFLACAATSHGAPEVISIRAHPETKSVTALIAHSGVYTLRDMPAQLTSGTLTFADREAKWSLDRASLKLTRVDADRNGDPVTQQCSHVTEQNGTPKAIF
ncbi:hypothetical protein [Novosphingobium terrae]|uniref:hypothetical protein n=1 Tax=Novosphingobium terrae TaxID=2726189 RepID=UPI00197EF429|nr:hypothetical protein [Novosphingobium terrae]